MRILRYILLALLVIIVLLALGGFIVFNNLTRGMLPQTAGELQIPGLNDTVEIFRDSYGVPHIYASNTYDLFFAQGYTHAQDRWWQMEWSRRLASGRIQELTGQNAAVLPNDIGLRQMGWRRVAERELEQTYDESAIAILQAFADGVNAYILNRAPGELALQYSLLGLTGVSIDIEPWVPADTVAWAKAMAWNLRDDGSEMPRSALIEALGEDMTAALYPPWPFGEKPTIILPEELPVLESQAALPKDTVGIVGLRADLAGSLFAPRDTSLGSNNWAVSGQLSATGAPLVANDMHLGLGMPSIWYEIGLHCRPVSTECPFDVVGFQFAPAPLVIAGHNARIAWGFTSHPGDVLDYYLIRVNPENPLQYEWNGAWRDMILHEETIRFGDSDDTITIQVRETHLGPIINDHRIEADGSVGGFNNDDPRAMRWTALEPGTLLKAVVLLNQASNWDEFRDALRYFDVPSQNVVYADVDGNIGMQIPGRFPIRAAGHTGMLPVPGWTDDYEWRDYIPFDYLPHVYNPARGYVASANQAVVPLAYFDQLHTALSEEFGDDINVIYSQEWSYGYRGQRIVELLEALAPHDARTFATIYGDNKNISAEELMPYLAALEFTDPELTSARDWLLQWDYQMHMDSPHAVLYAHFWVRLLDNLFAQRMGDLAGITGGGRWMWAVYLLAQQPDHSWWQNPDTSAVEARDDVLALAFEQAYSQAVETLGADRDQWRWGDLHTITFVSDPLGQSGIDLIEGIVNRGPVGTGGSAETVNAASWNAASGSFAMTSGVSQRVVYDLGDWTRSLSIITTGQSGHPYSPHYDDQIEQWRDIEFKPMLWSREQVEAAAASRLVLSPPG
jgi:penicillin amidase